MPVAVATVDGAGVGVELAGVVAVGVADAALEVVAKVVLRARVSCSRTHAAKVGQTSLRMHLLVADECLPPPPLPLPRQTQIASFFRTRNYLPLRLSWKPCESKWNTQQMP